MQHRDNLAREVAKQSRELKDIMLRLAQIEAESLQVSQQSVQLATRVAARADRAKKTKSAETYDHIQLRKDITTLEAELKVNKRFWEMARETASAIIVCSGLDWVRDQHLRALALDLD